MPAETIRGGREGGGGEGGGGGADEEEEQDGRIWMPTRVLELHRSSGIQGW